MKYNVTQLEGKNELVNFSHPDLGNYFIELELRNYQVEEANNGSDTHPISFSFCGLINLTVT